jgi:isopenicillin-N epimerase
VASTTALVLPVERVIAACRQRGVPVLVDGAHAPGMLDLDLDSLGADHYAGNCHKWLCSAKGCAFLYSRAGAALADAQLHPPVISLMHPAGFPTEFEWVGTRDPTAWLSLTEALAFHRELGSDRVRRHNRDLVLEAGALLTGTWNTDQVVPESMVGSMLTLLSPVQVEPTQEGAMGLRARLWREHRVEVMPVTVQGRTWIRISAQVYNELDDYRRLAEALA